MDCLKNCFIIIIYYVPAKLRNQRNNFSRNVEMNNKGIIHFKTRKNRTGQKWKTTITG